MDTSRNHLIVRLCRTALVGWLVVLAAACTATSTPSTPTPSSSRQLGSGIDLWRPHDPVSSGYLNGTWATGELSATTLQPHLVAAGLVQCASGVADELDGHRLILSANEGSWWLIKTDARGFDRLTSGVYHESRTGPIRVALSFYTTGARELSGKGSITLGGSNYNIRVSQMRPLDARPSCITAAEAIAWFLMPFTKTQVR